MKKLYVIDKLNIGGASDYLFFLASENMYENEVVVACNINFRSVELIPDYIKIIEFKNESLYFYILSNNFKIIHWFKSESSGFFNRFISEIKDFYQLPPIIITVCQVPVNFNLWLTQNELKYSQKIIFIDRFTYNRAYNKNIPDGQKTMIYFGTKFPMIDSPKDNNEKGYLLFGRGSSINKLHPQFLKWYNEIHVKNKKLCIVGIDPNTIWINDEIEKYNLKDQVYIFPHLHFEQWLDIVKTFDVFLYQLPSNSYSSIDGTLQAAMFFSIPIVFFGPEAPKELILHGQTGFIANNESEFVYYATLLSKDKDKRIEMGNLSRQRLIEHFSWEQTVNSYKQLYEEISLMQPIIYRLKTKVVLTFAIHNVISQIRKQLAQLLPTSLKMNIKSSFYKLNS